MLVFLDPVNGCCIKHDKCYEDQEGQKNCDDRFCGCLDVSSFQTLNQIVNQIMNQVLNGLFRRSLILPPMTLKFATKITVCIFVKWSRSLEAHSMKHPCNSLNTLIVKKIQH